MDVPKDTKLNISIKEMEEQGSQISNEDSNQNSLAISSEDEISKSILSGIEISSSKKPKNEKEVFFVF
jgi:hypothetical protein